MANKDCLGQLLFFVVMRAISQAVRARLLPLIKSCTNTISRRSVKIGGFLQVSVAKLVDAYGGKTETRVPDARRKCRVLIWQKIDQMR